MEPIAPREVIEVESSDDGEPAARVPSIDNDKFKVQTYDVRNAEPAQIYEHQPTRHEVHILDVDTSTCSIMRSTEARHQTTNTTTHAPNHSTKDDANNKRRRSHAKRNVSLGKRRRTDMRHASLAHSSARPRVKKPNACGPNGVCLAGTSFSADQPTPTVIARLPRYARHNLHDEHFESFQEKMYDLLKAEHEAGRRAGVKQERRRWERRAELEWSEVEEEDDELGKSHPWAQSQA